jgi:hypothetical protein
MVEVNVGSRVGVKVGGKVAVMTTGVGGIGVSAGVGVKVGVGGGSVGVGVGAGVLQAARKIKANSVMKIIVDFICIQEFGLGERDYYTP